MYDGPVTESPLALTALPQFEPEYWRKIERLMGTATISRVTNLPVGDDGEKWVEIVVGNNMAFRRKKSEINQFLHANQNVVIENIGGKICTGLLVPDVGWAWRMTAEDLAKYSRELAAQQYQRAQELRTAVLEFVTAAIMKSLDRQAVVVGEDDGRCIIGGSVDIKELAAAALIAVEDIGRQAQVSVV